MRKAKDDQPVKLMQSHSPAALAGLTPLPSDFFTAPKFNMDAAARVAYESFVKQLGLKIGQKVSDASGYHRVPSWDDHKTFVKARWRAVAQAVIDAACGVSRTSGLTSPPDMRTSPAKKVGEESHGKDLSIRRRKRTGDRATRRKEKSSSVRVDAKRSKLCGDRVL